MASALRDTLERQSGLLRAEPAVVGRSTYRGSGLLEGRAARDPRPGYRPVEWWVCSCVGADNAVSLPGEGETRIRLDDGSRPRLAELLRATDVFGDAAARWPLIKLLDIGGPPVPGRGGAPERPPIPPHVHAGLAEGGRLRGPGKRESYFFLPRAVPEGEPPAVTRIGLRAGVTAAQLLDAVRGFGRSDAAYALLEEFPIRPRESWLVPDRVLHAPGPWPTLEMQTPQDDFHLLGWQLGERLEGEALARERRDSLLRGLDSPEALVEQAVDLGARGGGEAAARRRSVGRTEERSPGARRTGAFVAPFRGELFELAAGARHRLPAAAEPASLLVWTGRGRANGLPLDAADWGARELLLAPGHALELEAASDAPLALVRFEPLPPGWSDAGS